jgi:hypothetical protein
VEGGWFALGGVFLAGLLAGFWQLITNAERRQEQRRQERLQLVSGIIADADTVWDGANDLANAIANIQGFPGEPSHEEQRQAAFRKIEPAMASLDLAIASAQIICPALSRPSRALRATSRTFRLEHHREDREERERAREYFIKQARKAIRK